MMADYDSRDIDSMYRRLDELDMQIYTLAEQTGDTQRAEETRWRELRALREEQAEIGAAIEAHERRQLHEFAAELEARDDPEQARRAAAELAEAFEAECETTGNAQACEDARRWRQRAEEVQGERPKVAHGVGGGAERFKTEVSSECRHRRRYQ